MCVPCGASSSNSYAFLFGQVCSSVYLYQMSVWEIDCGVQHYHMVVLDLCHLLNHYVERSLEQ